MQEHFTTSIREVMDRFVRENHLSLECMCVCVCVCMCAFHPCEGGHTKTNNCINKTGGRSGAVEDVQSQLLLLNEEVDILT